MWLHFGGGRTDITLLFIVVVSPCRCEALRAGCCGGEGVFVVLWGYIYHYIHLACPLDG